MSDGSRVFFQLGELYARSHNGRKKKIISNIFIFLKKNIQGSRNRLQGCCLFLMTFSSTGRRKGMVKRSKTSLISTAFLPKEFNSGNIYIERIPSGLIWNSKKNTQLRLDEITGYRRPGWFVPKLL